MPLRRESSKTARQGAAEKDYRAGSIPRPIAAASLKPVFLHAGEEVALLAIPRPIAAASLKHGRREGDVDPTQAIPRPIAAASLKRGR